MESIPLVTPPSPNRAVSAGPQRNPMEDADSSLTRKRPRLDSGSASYRSMSAERILPSPSAQESIIAQPTTPKDVFPRTPVSGNSEAKIWEGTPSRVTINVRDAAVRGTPVEHTVSAARDPACCDSDNDELPHLSDPGAFHKPKPEPPLVVSSSSSPSRSPEIEVADVEDINQEPGHTKWRVLSSVPDANTLRNEIWASFPFSDRAHHLWESADEIARHMQEEPIEDGLMFRQLSEWITLYLAATEPYPSQWLDLYVDQHDFWIHFVDVINAMCIRCNQRSTAVLPLPFRPDNSRGDIESFQDMFASFAALTFRMVEIDCQYLRRIGVGDQAKPELLSLRYVEWLRAVLSPVKYPLWRHLHLVYNYDATSTVSAIISRACRSPFNGLSSMSQMLHHLLDRARDLSDVVDKVAIVLETVFRMLDPNHLLRDESLGREQSALLSRDALLTNAYAFFRSASTLLQTFITKQVATLSHDLCDVIIRHLSAILQRITAASDELTTRILKEDLEIQQKFPATAAPVIAEEAWKFQILRKCFLEGRMEIRIQGVESMQHDLLSIHRKFIHGNPASDLHPVVPFLCDFIVDNKLIDYLVGVESHPKLIRSSGNIVGFLVVNRRYTEAESDKIWNTVSESQDPGVVGALIQMLPTIFNISDYSQLLYLVTKLNRVPLNAWDTRMTTYAGTLLTQTAARWKEKRQGYGMDEPPYHCCFRLLREASGDASLPFTNRKAMSLFASQALENLLDVGPTDIDRLRLYEDCIRDIATRTKFATGSICAINILLRHDTSTDIATLARDYHLSDLVIDEFEHITGQVPLGLHDLRLFDEALTVRLDLLQHIILSSPGSIDPKRGWNLWEAMVGSRAPSDQARDSALVMLVNTTMSLRKRNRFIDTCIDEYLPNLSPRFFTRNILFFVSQISHYGTFLEQTSNHAGNFPADMLGINILWRIALVAPPHTVERKAIETLVASYIDSPKARGAPKAAIERMHVEVVERCVRQLTTAASHLRAIALGAQSGENQPMVTASPNEEALEHRLSFSRSLLILRELFYKIRSHPSYSPVPSAPSQVNSDVEEIKGVPVTIRYQPFSGASNRPIKSLQIGDLETAQDLAQRFATLTGFSRFTVIVGGQKINLDEYSDATLRTTRFHERGLFLIKNIHGHESGPDLTPARVLRPLEKEVMAHFSDFYQFLSLDEGLSQNVLEFLKAFPPDNQAISLVSSKDMPIEDIFPPAMPFKALYSVYAYDQCLTISLQNGSSNQEFICHGIRAISQTLTSKTSVGASLTSNGDYRAVAGLVECLLKFLKEAARSEYSSRLLSENISLVERLLFLISSAEHNEDLPLASSLICGSLGCILEASLHSDVFFERFQAAARLATVLRVNLLRDSRQRIRVGIARSIRSICDHPTLESFRKHSFASFCWDSLVSIIPEILQSGQYAEEFCGVATTVFRSLNDSYRRDLNLAKYIGEWCKLLLQYRHDEFVGRDSLDWVIHGISDLIQWCIQFLKATKKPIYIDDNPMETLFRTHLFPQIFKPSASDPIKSTIPVLHSKTRDNLYGIVLALANSVPEYHALLRSVRGLLPPCEGPQAWSWGIAQIAEDYTYDVNWNFDRINAIRAPTGYPGLRNLTNTCYMNSLLTQLFMNLNFRGFILESDIADSTHTQRLLAESRTLFSFMQSTALKTVDTQGVADSLINYENTAIDVSVQMDVDEFYNLLFDRWESQISSDASKRTFRAFYGGQLVQQIKSKECPHISERLESFSAIQCDIQGKTNLTESLAAYVGGEVMEGDNKYSCTTCGTYVDAVKRACLKDVPDNLIFHLKRFDYDIMTGTRIKINDRFDFPERIDMSPYNVNFLQDAEQPPAPDNFELVGILVHTGTAESGHYYSYIKERPNRSPQNATWVEFNDADVTPFNPSHIPDACFGGVTEPTGYPAAPYAKSWNAYMLFYQRTRTMAVDYQPNSQDTMPPIKHLSSSPSPEERIAIDNKKFLRKYCMFDSTHARFVTSVLDRLRTITGSCCSDDHAVEKEALLLALEYCDQVLSRMKETTDFERLVDSLTSTIRVCSTCCKIALDWIATTSTAFRNLLLKCPTAKIRKSFVDMLVRALRYLRETDPQEYGLDVDSVELKSSHGVIAETSRGVLQRIVRNLRDLWPILHLYPRAWDDYFGVLVDIGEFSVTEASILLREDFLKSGLEVLIIESPGAKRLRVDNPHYNQLLRLIEKGRRYSLTNVCGLIQALMAQIDLQAPAFDPNYGDRLQLENGLFPLSNSEEVYLYYGPEPGRSRPLVCLDKMITSNSNPAAVTKILRIMISAEPLVGNLGNISRTILNGINIEPADLAEPHLRAALAFCETTSSQQSMREMIGQIAREVDTIGTSGGATHLDFFVKARRLENPRIPRRVIDKQVLRTVHLWGPPLLMYYEEAVRHATVNFLKELIFHGGTQGGDSGDEMTGLEDYARGLCEACIKRVQDQVIQPQHAVEVKSVNTIQSVVRYCVATYFGADTAEDEEVAVEAEEMYEGIQMLAVDETDDANSDTWNNSEGDLPSDSDSEKVQVSP